MVCTGLACDTCELGYFKHTSNDGHCYSFCPTGQTAFYSHDHCLGGNAEIADFNFTQELIDGDRIWTYDGCNTKLVLTDE